MDKLRHCLLVTDRYYWLIRPFAYLFRKYYGNDRVTIIGNIEPDELPAGFEYMRVPAYSEGIWDWRDWFSVGLRSALLAIDEPLVTLFLPDQFITRTVDKANINDLIDYLYLRPNIIRANITDDGCFEAHGIQIDQWKNLDIMTISPTDIHCGFQGGITFTPSIWHTKTLARFLRDDWDLWRAERVGTEFMAKQNKLIAIGTRQPLLYRTHILQHNRPDTLFLSELPDRDIVKQWLPATMTIA